MQKYVRFIVQLQAFSALIAALDVTATFLLNYTNNF